jgi:poly-gamma-glutamate synthesis protein (capsule biosynthesis protein)
VLANNHVLDWGRRGLIDTLAALRGAGIRSVGAGETLAAAAAPVAIPLAGGGRLLVFAFGLPTSGVPMDWAATATKPGVNFLPDLSHVSRRHVTTQVCAMRQPGDIVLLSIHWGTNWGYGISSRQTRFAHRLIDKGVVDIVHGHSSHHPRPIEVYRGRLVLYGCGDLLNDYEGIKGHCKEFRGDLSLLYFATIERSTGRLAGLTMVPYRIRKFRLNRAAAADAEWLRAVLDRESRAFGARVEHDADGHLALGWR